MQIAFGTPEEIECVRWLFSAFDGADATLRQFVSDLNTKGTPSPAGNQLSEVIMEPPLISAEQFERVQARIRCK